MLIVNISPEVCPVWSNWFGAIWLLQSFAAAVTTVLSDSLITNNNLNQVEFTHIKSKSSAWNWKESLQDLNCASAEKEEKQT